MAWLEEFLLRQSHIALLVVSHDREFVNRVGTKLVDIEDGVTVTYPGDYAKFLEQKALRRRLWVENYDKQCRLVREEERFIVAAKNNPDAAISSQARSKELALQKLKASDSWILPPPREKRFRFRFPPPPRCVSDVVVVEDLSHSYTVTASSREKRARQGNDDTRDGTGGNRQQLVSKDVDLFVDFSTVIRRGERIGLVGPNGSGRGGRLQYFCETKENTRNTRYAHNCYALFLINI